MFSAIHLLIKNNFLYSSVSFPTIKSYDILAVDEKLISLSDNGFLVDSQYYNQGVAGSYKDCYARESVVEKLKQAETFLPKGLRFKVYDAYRPICVQQRLWDFYRKDVIWRIPCRYALYACALYRGRCHFGT
jgi:D-alanyl-D-alanine dipeptidase